MSGWVSVRVRTSPADRELVSQALFAEGAGGVQEDGEFLVTHFPPGTDPGQLKQVLTSAAAGATIEIGETPNVDWSESWKKGIRAHTLGVLTVTPPWLASQFPPDASVVIEPAAGFGTGEHPSTRSVIRLMQKVIQPGDVVADLGSGSGVLSIAAAKLGASRVVAIEMDEDSNENAALNIGLNGVGDVVTLLPGDAGVLLPLVAPVHLVLANIISSVLLELLPGIHRALSPGGHAVLAGLLFTEREMMLARFGEDWRVVAEDHEGDWWAVLLACHPAQSVRIYSPATNVH